MPTTLPTLPTGAKTRLVYLDIARGIGILLVVFAHGGLLGAVGPWVYEFYMPLFFVLTGYLYGKTQPDAPAQKRRLGKLAAEYFTTCGVLFAAWVVLFGLRGQGGQAPRLLFSIGYGRFIDPANPLLLDGCWCGQLWFFTLMATGSALYFLLCRLVRRVGDTLPCRLLVAGGLLGAAALFGASPLLLPWCLDTAPMAALLLFTGHWLATANWFDGPPTAARWGVLGGAAVVFILLHDRYDLHMRYYGRFNGLWGALCFYAAGLCGSLLLISFCGWLGRCQAAPLKTVSHGLQYLGKNSMAVFEYHILGIFLLQQLLARLPLPGMAAPLLFVPGCLGIAWLCIVGRQQAARLLDRLRRVCYIAFR
ncbi:MAG: acyltransferase family protein [Gemmiger sp.]|nr:acyltransferase family protein [Gemmiger sp.]